MLYILDTDHVSLAQRGHPHVTKHIATALPHELAVSIVTAHEQLRGRMAQVNRASTAQELIFAYKLLHETLRLYLTVSVVDFDEQAAAIVDDLSQRKIRIGTLGLRIAAIALANDATLVTRNQRDFERIPGLMIKDWSVST
ncbi:MAG: type II toxin-antitoxin system VapC family toxin [Thermoflexales bacterium]|nr:type II toxin-antitoxin system VapC family toxin [Thermoflexales bacterium]